MSVNSLGILEHLFNYFTFDAHLIHYQSLLHHHSLEFLSAKYCHHDLHVVDQFNRLGHLKIHLHLNLMNHHHHLLHYLQHLHHHLIQHHHHFHHYLNILPPPYLYSIIIKESMDLYPMG